MPLLCISGGAAAAKLAVTAFTLAWMHTVEHTAWQEDWRVAGDVLVLDTARVEGSGAGMEPPPDAVKAGRFYEWHPRLAVPEVLLSRAPQAGEWRLCTTDGCRTLSSLLPAGPDPVRLAPCPTADKG